MLKVENTETSGWEPAVRGMRNPKNSWEKSDSSFKDYAELPNCPYKVVAFDDMEIGSNDLKLMTALTNAGTDHRKFLRMIVVYADITAPLYWWKEFDTYKVGTVANSCSTMHKIHARDLTLDDFSHEHLFDGVGVVENPDNDMEHYENPTTCVEYVISVINHYRRKYLETKDKRYWWQLIQLLPSSYNQRRTVMLNYEVLSNIYRARRSHKLDEWHSLCAWIESLPYATSLICNINS
jgi:hypothetical protein